MLFQYILKAAVKEFYRIEDPVIIDSMVWLAPVHVDGNGEFVLGNGSGVRDTT